MRQLQKSFWHCINFRDSLLSKAKTILMIAFLLVKNSSTENTHLKSRNFLANFKNLVAENYKFGSDFDLINSPSQ